MRTLLFRVIFVIFFLQLFFFPKNVFAQSDTGWVINSFESKISINEDTSVDVAETIEADFKTLSKHGIYREIPVKYKTASGNNLDVRFELDSVTDLSGNAIPVKVENKGDGVSLRIGNSDSTVTGENTYVISYSVQRVLTTPDDGVEFYWNVTGDDWSVPISNSSVIITTPDGAVTDIVCLTGRYGQSGSSCKAYSSNNIVFAKTGNLNPRQGFTVAAALDEEMFVFPTLIQEITWFLEDNLIFFTPLVVFAFMFVIYLRRGRDRKFKNIFYEQAGYEFVSPFEKAKGAFTFKPSENLTPGEVGLLVDEKVHNRDITAIAIDLARRGFFNIKETQKGKIFKSSDYELTSTGKGEGKLIDFEKSVLDMLFGSSRNKGATARLGKLHKGAYKHQKKIQDRLYDHMTQNGYFVGNPNKVRNKYVGVGIAILFLAGIFPFVITAIPFISTTGLIFAVVASALIILLFGFVMPARSAKGRKALVEVVGLREYVRVGAWRQEKYEEWNYFEEILPYTIAFGLTQKFINAFKDANIPQPEWYQSKSGFNALAFSNAMNNFDSSFAKGVNATRPKSASSGGSGFSGGFSGGGFGGGGGGSW